MSRREGIADGRSPLPFAPQLSTPQISTPQLSGAEHSTPQLLTAGLSAPQRSGAGLSDAVLASPVISDPVVLAAARPAAPLAAAPLPAAPLSAAPLPAAPLPAAPLPAAPVPAALPAAPAVLGASAPPFPRGTAAVIPASLAVTKAAASVYEIVILGAGCAGLSACLALLEAGVSGPILMIDSRTEYLDDRTWCFWDVEPTRFTHLARARWTTWEVATASAVVRAESHPTPYVCLAASDFYTFALAALADAGSVEVRLGESAGEPVNETDGARVSTSTGVVHARHVLDCRGLPPLSREDVDPASTWIPQQFVGRHILSHRAVFDPGVCRLMDFSVDQSGGVRFMYVLPTSPFEALVEDVYMAETTADIERYRSEIDAYLLASFGLSPSEFTVLGEERGYIPMTDHTFVSRPSPNITRLGISGGATRPSTGYTFLGIQRSCRTAVDRIVEGTADVAQPPCSLLDTIFLRFLADHPSQAPRVFSLLFGRVETASLVRFLTERSGLLDHARLILALPKAAFLATAMRALAERWVARRSAGRSARRSVRARGEAEEVVAARRVAARRVPGRLKAEEVVAARRVAGREKAEEVVAARRVPGRVSGRFAAGPSALRARTLFRRAPRAVFTAAGAGTPSRPPHGG